jgi:hypothetical protein
MITKDQILSASGAELSRLAGEVLQASPHGHIAGQSIEEMEFSYFHCKVCGEVNFEPDSHCPLADSIPLTPDNQVKWRDWAVEKYGVEKFLEATCFQLGHETQRTVVTNLVFVHGESVFWRCLATPAHYIKAACLCKIESN